MYIKNKYKRLISSFKSKVSTTNKKNDLQHKNFSTKKNDNSIILKIANSFKDRSRKDIQSWRQALLACSDPENPRFDRYFDLIEDLMTDGTLKTQVLLRKSASLSVGFQVRNSQTGEINEKTTKLISQKWFYKLLNVHLDSIIYGAKVIEFLNFKDENIDFAVIPERNTSPTHKRIYTDLTKTESFIEYNDDFYKHWVIELGGDNPFGLINDIVPNLIWKRNVAQSWAEFCEKFGMPMVSATTNNSNTSHIDRVEKQLLSLAEMSVGVFPEGTTIKFDEANRTDAYNVYSKFIEHNTKEISGVIVGSDTLSQQATNRSQTEVHERSLDYKISQADRREIAFTINDVLFPLLQNHGYSFISNDDVFEWIESKEEIDLNQYWVIVQGLMQQYEIDQDWLSKTFNIPIKNARHFLIKNDQSNLDNSKTNNHKFLTLNSKLNLPTSCCSQEGFLKYPIAKGEKWKSNSDKLIDTFYNGNDTLGHQGTLIVEEALELVGGLKKGFGVTTGYNTPDTLAYQLMEYNLFEFSASKTEARMATMTDLLIDKDKNQIRPFNEFKDLVSKQIDKFSNQYLKTEYNFSVSVGQQSAAYQRFLSESDEITTYLQYQTVGDANVRGEHQELNGKIFNIKDKEAMKLFPPNAYGCRCEMIQYTGEGKSTDGKQAIDTLDKGTGKFLNSQFAINRGDLKQVFTEKQFYSDTKGLPEKLNQMTFERYDLPKYKSFKHSLNPIKLDQTITPENIGELFKKVKNQNFMGFTDYFDRKIILSEKVFKTHISGKYIKPSENRHQLFPHIKNILKNPDEVWYNKVEGAEKTFQSRYIKFYGDLIMVVDTRFDIDLGLEIYTWYPCKIEEEKLRKGLLVGGENKKSLK